MKSKNNRYKDPSTRNKIENLSRNRGLFALMKSRQEQKRKGTSRRFGT